MPSLIINFLNFLSNNKDLIKDNLLVFITSWILCAFIGGGAVALINKHRIRKLKDKNDRLNDELKSVTMHYNNLRAVFDKTDDESITKVLKSGTGRKYPIISSDNN